MQFRKRAGLTALLLLFFISMLAGCASVGTRDSGLITLETAAEEEGNTSSGGSALPDGAFSDASGNGSAGAQGGGQAAGTSGDGRNAAGITPDSGGAGINTPPSGPAGGTAAADNAAPIVVHVCGAVNRAGVYTLDAGSRIYEAVRAAGGFAADADEAYINQAQILTDGVRLRIPTTEETHLLMAGGTGDISPSGNGTAGRSEASGALSGSTGGIAVVSGGTDPSLGSSLAVISGGTDSGSSSAAGGTTDGLVNINTADAETLCTLNGIGPSTAAKIIDYRQSHGTFKRIEDIMQISGIKEKLFAKIRDHITV